MLSRPAKQFCDATARALRQHLRQPEDAAGALMVLITQDETGTRREVIPYRLTINDTVGCALDLLRMVRRELLACTCGVDHAPDVLGVEQALRLLRDGGHAPPAGPVH